MLWLVILGGIAEVAGVLLAAREVRDRLEARAIFDRPRPVAVKAEGPRVRVTAERPLLWNTEGLPPTTEVRVERLEAEASSLRRQLAETRQQGREDVARMEERLLGSVTDVKADLYRTVEPVRELVLATTGGSRRYAVMSVGLLLGGVASQTAAGIMSVVQ